MGAKTLIKNIQIVSEGTINTGDVLVEGMFIKLIGDEIDDDSAIVIDGTGKLLIPGIIDGQVHFREPGLTHKADLYLQES